MIHYAITIARGYGSGGRRIGQKLADRLDVDFVDRELLQLASIESGINEELFGEVDERLKRPLLFKSRKNRLGEVLSPAEDGFISDENLFNFQAKVLRSLIERESFVVIGRAADFVLKEYPNVLSVSVQAPHPHCVTETMHKLGYDEKDADAFIVKTDKYRADFYEFYTGRRWNDPLNFDLCLNSGRLDDDACLALIERAAALKFGPDFSAPEKGVPQNAL